MTDRITVPLGSAPRETGAAVALAAGLARDSGYTVELVVDGQDWDGCRHWAAVAQACGAPDVTSIALGDDDLATFAAWSGTELWCVARSWRGADLPRVPALVAGPRCAVRQSAPRRVVVGVGSQRAGGTVVPVAARFAERTGAELVLVEVFHPATAVAEVPECARLHGIARTLAPSRPDYETLHDRHPVAGIVRFLDEATVVAVGASAQGRHRVVPALVRRACCPVLIVPR